MAGLKYRPHWTDDAYAAAISAVTDKMAKLSLHNTGDYMDLRQAAEVLRHERALMARRTDRRTRGVG